MLDLQTGIDAYRLHNKCYLARYLDGRFLKFHAKYGVFEVIDPVHVYFSLVRQYGVARECDG